MEQELTLDPNAPSKAPIKTMQEFFKRVKDVATKFSPDNPYSTCECSIDNYGNITFVCYTNFASSRFTSHTPEGTIAALEQFCSSKKIDIGIQEHEVSEVSEVPVEIIDGLTHEFIAEDEADKFPSAAYNAASVEDYFTPLPF